jgi:hypothetical protein
MNDEELAKLDWCCEVTGKPRSVIIREGVDATYKKLKRKLNANSAKK